MPWVGFEPTTLVFERAKTIHALDRAATVIRVICSLLNNIGSNLSDTAVCKITNGVPWSSLSLLYDGNNETQISDIEFQ
jgi:hypothetical protein